MYASLLEISGALDLGIFEQPAHSVIFRTLPVNTPRLSIQEKYVKHSIKVDAWFPQVRLTVF
jgi:hypothetical protein